VAGQLSNGAAAASVRRRLSAHTRGPGLVLVSLRRCQCAAARAAHAERAVWVRADAPWLPGFRPALPLGSQRLSARRIPSRSLTASTTGPAAIQAKATPP
jgi:hypothetical protein